MAETSKSAPVMLLLLAIAIGYAGWSGDGLNMVGMKGISSRVAAVDSSRDTLTALQASIDTANRELKRESVDDVKKRIAAYQAQLTVLRALVPESREIPDLLDNVSMRAKARGVTLSSAITPHLGVVGPGPFETYTYQMSVIGHYHQIGRFLTDVASLRRIIVPTDIKMASSTPERARVLGDTTAMLEVQFTVKTFVKQSADGGTPNEK